jgi:iron(III) transport system ATP-binding protein
MQAGRIVQSGSPVELYRRPANVFVAGFFGPVNRFASRVRGGRVATPVGDVPAAAVGEGAEVEAIVRPEAIRLRGQPDGLGVRARVVHRRDLGPMHVLRLGLADGSTVKVRQSGGIAARVGDEVEIDLDPAHLFVYPARR